MKVLPRMSSMRCQHRHLVILLQSSLLHLMLLLLRMPVLLTIQPQELR